MNELKRLKMQLEAETAARMRAEEKLLHKNEELNLIHENEAKKEQIIEAEKTNQLNKAKHDFLENISHEIRTPLTAIIGFTETLKDSNLEKEEKTNALETICRNAQDLLNIINDILEASSEETETEESSIHDTYFIDILNEMEEKFHPKAKEKGIEFSINYALPIPTSIISNTSKLTTILNHIIKNAIKFTDEGKIFIDVRYANDTSELKITITDSGIGICESQQAELFQPFFQEDTSASRKYGGAGLGLFVSKQLAESINGKIKLIESNNKGSCFEISIATDKSRIKRWLEQEKELKAFQHSLDDPDIVPKLHGSVLLAEDALDNQQLIEMYVDVTGAEIDIVENGQLAVESAMAKNYDLIIMDIQMPVMDGVSATEMLRMTGYSRPIVALSANVVKGDAHKYLSTGFNYYLPKPINKTHFFKTLSAYLNHEKTQSASDKAKAIQNSSAYKKIIENFVTGLPTLISTIKTDFEKEEWEEFSRKIHSLKGSGGTFGYHDITDYCTQIEKELEANNHSEIAYLFQQLETCASTITKVNNNV